LDFDADIRARKDVLEETGYLLNGLLTQKGLLASEIHEGHNLLMSHAFTEKLLHNKEADDIIVSLSVFLEDVQTDEAIEKISFHEKLKEVAKQIYDVEQIKSEYSYWTLTSYWAEVVWEWLQGNDFVCEKFGVDHGNFVRAILKLSNILEEWMNLATMCQDVEMVEKLKDSSKKLLRGFVIPDSLYLRI
jgi:superfamily II RNA helicase